MASVIEAFTTLPWLFYSVITVLSLIVGSFLNVVIHRLPIMMENEWKLEYQNYFHPEESTDESNKTFNLAVPRSACPHCGHQIRAWENIPVLSYLILGGKCSNCGEPISIRYPSVELITALLSLWVAWHFGPSLQACIAILITWLLVAMTGIDLDKMLLPDQLTLPMLWIGIIASTQNLFVSMNDAIWGASIGYLSLWSVYWLFKIVTGKEGMGHGDFKLLAALGAFVGWQGLVAIILLSSLVGAVVGISIMLIQGKDRNLAIPFGPYLAAAGFLTLLYGTQINDYYLTQILGM